MRLRSAILAIAVAATPAVAQESRPVAAAAAPEAIEPTLDDLRWVARPLVIFADSPDDPRFVQQLKLLDERLAELEERGVVVLTDTDPAAHGPLRKALRPRGFGVVLIDKDGIVAQRHPTPVTAREVINLIDRMPSRREETGSRRR
jgi:uncharacterized protein DUF4174